MDLEERFSLIARAIKDHSTFSQPKSGWTISVLHLKAVLQPHTEQLSREPPSVEEILEQGVQIGLWEMDFDRESEMDIVVFR
jgi:hypothetical protein